MARGIHRLLVHRVLTVVGWVTLTGLLSRRPPVWLWLLRLIPLIVYLLLALGAVNLLVSHPSRKRVVDGMAVYGFFVNIAFNLMFVLYRRSDMDELDDQLERLEKMASCNSPVLHRQILIRIAMFITLATISCSLWICFPLVGGDFTHGNYMISVKLPLALETQQGYWYCLAFQIFAVVLSWLLQVAFDCCYFTWFNAITFHLIVIRNRVETFCVAQSECIPKTKNMSSSVISEEDLGILRALPGETDPKMHTGPFPNHEQPKQEEKRSHLFLGSTAAELKREVGTLEEVRALEMIDLHYSQVAALCRTVNRFSGPPILVMHASTMTVVLFSVYACIMLASDSPKSGLGTQLTGFIVFFGIFILRVISVSIDGGRITEQCEELSATLASMEWIHLSRGARDRREALLQKTSQPLRISAAGVFNINKINILNIFSFVLTYLVVMVQ